MVRDNAWNKVVLVGLIDPHEKTVGLFAPKDLICTIPSCAPSGNLGGRGLEESFASDDAKPSNRFAQDTSSPPGQLTRWSAGSHKRPVANRQDAGPCILLSEVLVPENEPASGGLVLGHRARDGYFLRKGADLLLVVNKGTVW